MKETPMKKSSLSLIALALSATLAMGAMATPTYAANHGNGQQRGQQMDDHHGPRGDKMGQHRGQGGFLSLACSTEANDRLTNRLDHFAERIDLTAEQATLFETFKTDAGSAQDYYAANCAEPLRASASEDDSTRPNPAQGMEIRQTNLRAMADALDLVIPSADAFFSSLSEDQLSDLRPGGHGPMGRGNK